MSKTEMRTCTQIHFHIISTSNIILAIEHPLKLRQDTIMTEYMSSSILYQRDL